MADKAKSKVKTRQDRRNAILSIVRAYLNLDTLRDYQYWCENNGFSTSLNKTQREVLREYADYKHAEAINALKKYNSRVNYKNLIKKLHANEIGYAELGSDVLKEIYDAFEDANNQALFRDVLLHLAECSDLLDSDEYIYPIMYVVDYSSQWLQQFSDWKPKSKNIGRQFESFVRFLFARFDLPKFMYSAWWTGAPEDIGWFIHMGLGKNIRTAKSVPVKLSKRMAHLFLQAPDYYSVRTALRWGQVHALGGNKRICDAVCETRLGRDFKNDDFWVTVIQFFINHPELDHVHYGPVVDYIYFIKFDTDREGGAAQPKFNIKARTPAALLRSVQEWHLKLSNIASIDDEKWHSSNIIGFRYLQKGTANTGNKTWTIQELRSNKELAIEGQTQSHCVASYSDECRNGESSIWTMHVNSKGSKIKLLTIEVENSTRKIVQIRGRHNRASTADEEKIVKLWASRAKLKISRYAFDD